MLAASVLLRRDRLKVLRIAAEFVSAEVVNL